MLFRSSVDLGAKLGFASHMSQLTRISSAGMSLDDSLTLDEIAERVAVEDFSFLQPLELGIGDLVKIDLTKEQAEDVRFGRFIDVNSNETQVAGFFQGKLLAILEKRDEEYKPRKVFL